MHVISLKAHYSWLHFKQEKLESKIFFLNWINQKKTFEENVPTVYNAV